MASGRDGQQRERPQWERTWEQDRQVTDAADAEEPDQRDRQVAVEQQAVPRLTAFECQRQTRDEPVGREVHRGARKHRQQLVRAGVAEAADRGSCVVRAMPPTSMTSPALNMRAQSRLLETIWLRMPAIDQMTSACACGSSTPSATSTAASNPISTSPPGRSSTSGKTETSRRPGWRSTPIRAGGLRTPIGAVPRPALRVRAQPRASPMPDKALPAAADNTLPPLPVSAEQSTGGDPDLSPVRPLLRRALGEDVVEGPTGDPAEAAPGRPRSRTATSSVLRSGVFRLR